MDVTIAELVREGADEALDLLLDRFGGEIQGVAYLIVRDRLDAEDIMADTLITAWRKGHELRDPDALRSWLLKIATNKALSMRRTRSRTVRLADDMEFRGPDSTALLAGRLALSTAVADLPAQMRAAIVLHYYADLPVEEVARILGKRPNTVKSQLRVGLERLRSVYGAAGGRDGDAA